MSTYCRHGTITTRCALCRLAAGDPDLVARLREQKTILGEHVDYAPPAPRPLVHECDVPQCHKAALEHNDYCERHAG